MEVSLVDADGIPDGCVLSIRAGGTKRQASVEANKPCKLMFPKALDWFSTTPLKVDLLAPLGTVAFEASREKQRYPFEVKSRYGGKSIQVTLRVRQEDIKASSFDEDFLEPDAFQGSDNGLDAACALESPALRHGVALEHRGYIDSHNVLDWMDDMLQDLVKDRPKDPWSFIDASTARARLKHSKAKKSKADLAAIRSQAKSAILQGARSGKLGAALKAEELLFAKIDYNGDGIIDRDEMEHAIATGLIKKPPGWVTRKEAAVVEKQEMGTVGHLMADLAATVETSPTPVDTLQNYAAYATGTTMASTPRRSAENDLDLLRQISRETMLKASSDGTLVQALREVTGQARMGDFRRLPNQAFGAIHSMFERADGRAQQSRPKTEAEILFAKIDYKGDGIIDRDEMERAIATGLIKKPPGWVTRKEAALTEQLSAEPEVDLDGLRKDAGRQMIASLRNGNLKAALTEQLSAESEIDLDRLRKDAGQQMLASLRDGNLKAALSEQLSHEPLTAPAPFTFSATAPTASSSSSAIAPLPIRSAPPPPGGEASPASGLRRSNSTGSSPATSARRIHSRSGIGRLAPLSPPAVEPRSRQDQFIQDNDSLRRENARLKKLREAGDQASQLCSENDRLRSELGRITNVYKTEGSSWHNGNNSRKF